MGLPAKSHRAWKRLLLNDPPTELSLLPAKILLVRLNLEVRNDRSPGKVSRCAARLREVYAANQKLPAAQADIKAIFG